MFLASIDVSFAQKNGKVFEYSDTVSIGEILFSPKFPQKDNAKTRLKYAYKNAIPLCWNDAKNLAEGEEIFIGHGIYIKKIDKMTWQMDVFLWRKHGVLPWKRKDVLTIWQFLVVHKKMNDKNIFNVYQLPIIKK
jgi:hypothetical protein